MQTAPNNDATMTDLLEQAKATRTALKAGAISQMFEHRKTGSKLLAEFEDGGIDMSDEAKLNILKLIKEAGGEGLFQEDLISRYYFSEEATRKALKMLEKACKIQIARSEEKGKGNRRLVKFLQD